MLMNTLGLSIITEAMRSASRLFISTKNVGEKKIAEYRESLVYIQGTGLELTMQDYGVQLDAEELRNSFFTTFDQRQYIATS